MCPIGRHLPLGRRCSTIGRQANTVETLSLLRERPRSAGEARYTWHSGLTTGLTTGGGTLGVVPRWHRSCYRWHTMCLAFSHAFARRHESLIRGGIYETRCAT